MTHEAADVGAISKTMLVDVPLDTAFSVFTTGIATWWPLKTHSVGREEVVTATVEPTEDGRVYERLVDGSETDWGRVLVWDPPRRFVMSWHVGRDETRAQELELRFSREGDRTRVELEHRGWERLGEKGPEVRGEYERGWDFVLGRYAERLS